MPSTPARHGRSIVVFVLILVSGMVVGVLTHQSSSAESSSRPTSLAPSTSSSSTTVTAPAEAELVPLPPPSNVAVRAEAARTLTSADGLLPKGATVFSAAPAITNLDAALLGALRRAATDAAGFGVRFTVDSGWRSTTYQERLLQQAISKYGSRAAASRWVAPPDKSAHVSGDAVDIGPFHATAWLAEHGARYGLCQIYRNEPWHFELRPNAATKGCPAMYADAAHDPRMQ